VGEVGREILHEKGAGRQAVGTRRHKAKKVRWSFPYALHYIPVSHLEHSNDWRPNMVPCYRPVFLPS
jgi:hypothetical protein